MSKEVGEICGGSLLLVPKIDELKLDESSVSTFNSSTLVKTLDKPEFQENSSKNEAFSSIPDVKTDDDFKFDTWSDIVSQSFRSQKDRDEGKHGQCSITQKHISKVNFNPNPPPPPPPPKGIIAMVLNLERNHPILWFSTRK